jgi:hypothetical protein
MDEEYMVYMYSGILFSLKKEKSEICDCNRYSKAALAEKALIPYLGP